MQISDYCTREKKQYILIIRDLYQKLRPVVVASGVQLAFVEYLCVRKTCDCEVTLHKSCI